MVYPEDGEPRALPLPEGDGYILELEDFVGGIERGALSGVVTPESAARSVAVCLEEKRSIIEGSEISLAEGG